MNDIGFSFPADVTVLLKKPPPSISNLVQKQWSRFATPIAINKPSIIAHPVDILYDTKLHRPLGTGVQPYTFQITDKGAVALFYYRGKPDLQVCWCATGIRVDYHPRPGMANRLYGVLLWLLQNTFNKEGAALLHGAVIVPKDTNSAVLLTGPRGSGKTLLLLTLLKNAKGSYLAEDKTILFKNQVFCFHNDVPIQDHHIEALPWLVEQSTAINQLARYRLRRMRRRRFLEHHLPSYLLSRFEKWVMGSASVPVNTLMGRNDSVKKAPLHRILILTPGDAFVVRECSRSQGIAALMCIQEQTLGTFSRLQQHLFLWSQKHASSPITALNEIEKTVSFFRVDLPSDWNPVEIAEELRLC